MTKWTLWCLFNRMSTTQSRLLSSLLSDQSRQRKLYRPLTLVTSSKWLSKLQRLMACVSTQRLWQSSWLSESRTVRSSYSSSPLRQTLPARRWRWVTASPKTWLSPSTWKLPFTRQTWTQCRTSSRRKQIASASKKCLRSSWKTTPRSSVIKPFKRNLTHGMMQGRIASVGVDRRHLGLRARPTQILSDLAH